MSDIDPVALLIESIELEQKAHSKDEKKKLHTLRAGNSGVITEDGHYIGKCGRLSALRFHGIKTEEFGFSKLLMFQGGFLNEDWWLKHLKKTWKGEILTETEVPTQWYTTSGVTVSGRPDIVLAENGVLKMGIELKKACSIWTTRDVYFNKRPKMPHMAQAAHYMWQLKIPFKLIYTNNVQYYAPSWKTLGWPEPGEPGSEIIEYDDKGKVKNILPMIRSFDMRLVDDRVYYRVTGEEEWTATVLDVAGIQRYYETVADAALNKKLTPRPLNARPDGTRENWSFCKSCPMSSNCDKNENDPEKWWEEVDERR
jgi:hypothetical protein